MAHRQWHDLYKRSSSSFLFASSDGKVPSTARKVHIRRLCDILHLSIQRGDLPRARRAFGLLARCEEIEWIAIWKLGLLLLAHDSAPGGDAPGTAKHIDFLRVMMLQYPEQVRASLHLLVWFQTAAHLPSPTTSLERSILAHHLSFQRESLLQELVLSLALTGREREALDELELCGSLALFFFFVVTYSQLYGYSYLPSLPYQDNSVLHTYAGLLCLRLAPCADTDLNRANQGM
jgi:RNA polymerase I-specific transcription initiation factor RRN11